jgi:8-oxo-dGTP pyrophosphatase MutT (NUDIX family)
MSSQKHPWQISSGPRRLEPRWSADIPGNAHKIYWVQTHYFLFTTTQKDGIPTDTQHHDAVWWFPLDDLPAMLWPEQRRLIETHRETCETVFSAPQRRTGIQVDG